MATAKADKPVVANTSQEPQIRWKSEQTFRHDLFKLKVSSAKKNNSWKTGVLMLEDVEHCHFFHSHNSKGLPNKFCAPTAGHFHEVTTSIESDGTLTAKCGPPLKIKKQQLKAGGTRKTNVGISWLNEQVPDGEGNATPYTDNHTHEVEYKGSEQVSVNARKANARAAMAMSMMQPKPTHLDIKEK